MYFVSALLKLVKLFVVVCITISGDHSRQEPVMQLVKQERVCCDHRYRLFESSKCNKLWRTAEQRCPFPLEPPKKYVPHKMVSEKLYYEEESPKQEPAQTLSTDEITQLVIVFCLVGLAWLTPKVFKLRRAQQRERRAPLVHEVAANGEPVDIDDVNAVLAQNEDIAEVGVDNAIQAVQNHIQDAVDADAIVPELVENQVEGIPNEGQNDIENAINGNAIDNDTPIPDVIQHVIGVQNNEPQVQQEAGAINIQDTVHDNAVGNVVGAVLDDTNNNNEQQIDTEVEGVIGGTDNGHDVQAHNENADVPVHNDNNVANSVNLNNNNNMDSAAVTNDMAQDDDSIVPDITTQEPMSPQSAAACQAALDYWNTEHEEIQPLQVEDDSTGGHPYDYETGHGAVSYSKFTDDEYKMEESEVPTHPSTPATVPPASFGSDNTHVLVVEKPKQQHKNWLTGIVDNIVKQQQQQGAKKNEHDKHVHQNPLQNIQNFVGGIFKPQQKARGSKDAIEGHKTEREVNAANDVAVKENTKEEKIAEDFTSIETGDDITTTDSVNAVEEGGVDKTVTESVEDVSSNDDEQAVLVGDVKGVDEEEKESKDVSELNMPTQLVMAVNKKKKTESKRGVPLVTEVVHGTPYLCKSPDSMSFTEKVAAFETGQTPERSDRTKKALTKVLSPSRRAAHNRRLSQESTETSTSTDRVTETVSEEEAAEPAYTKHVMMQDNAADDVIEKIDRSGEAPKKDTTGVVLSSGAQGLAELVIPERHIIGQATCKSSPEKTPGSPRSGNVTPTKSVRTPSPRSSSLRGRLLRAQQNNAVIQDALAYSRRKKDSVIITDEKKPVSEENLENTLKTDDVHIRDQTPEKTPKSPEKTPKSPEKTPKSPEKSFNAIELPINVKSPEKAYNAADYDVGGAQYNWW